jgi:hypothetical protein
MGDTYRWHNPLSSPFTDVIRISPAAPVTGELPENAKGTYPARLTVSMKADNSVQVQGFFEKPLDNDDARNIRLRNVFRYDAPTPVPPFDVYTFFSIVPIFHAAADSGIEIRFSAPKKKGVVVNRILNLIVDSGVSYIVNDGLFDHVFVLLMGADKPRVTLGAKARIRDAVHFFTISGVRNASIAIEDCARSCPSRVYGAITTQTMQSGWSADDALPIQTYTDTGRFERASRIGSHTRIARFKSMASLGEFFDMHASFVHEIVRPIKPITFARTVRAVRAWQPVETRDLVIPSSERIPVNDARAYKSLRVAPTAANLLPY